MANRRRRIAALAGGAALALALTTGCAPDPAPSPTPTGFASDAEAYAAAEATYRAYSDALNNLRSGDENGPAPESFLTGAALASSIDGDQRLEAAGLRLVGPSEITRIVPRSATESSATLEVCIDSSKARVLNDSGKDVTPSDRQDLNGLEIEVVFAMPDPLIIRSDIADGSECS